MAQRVTQGTLPDVVEKYIKGYNDKGEPLYGTIVNKFSWRRSDYIPDGKEAVPMRANDNREMAGLVKRQVEEMFKGLRDNLEKADVGPMVPSREYGIKQFLTGVLERFIENVAAPRTQDMIMAELRMQGLRPQEAREMAQSVQRDALQGILMGIADHSFEREAGLPVAMCGDMVKDIERMQHKFDIDPTLIDGANMRVPDNIVPPQSIAALRAAFRTRQQTTGRAA